MEENLKRKEIAQQYLSFRTLPFSNFGFHLRSVFAMAAPSGLFALPAVGDVLLKYRETLRGVITGTPFDRTKAQLEGERGLKHG